MKVALSCREISIPYSDMLRLREEGKLNLGIKDEVAALVQNNKGFSSQQKVSNAAFHFWNWVAIGVFLYSIYLSFTDKLWWFVGGFIMMSVIWKANKKANSENILADAMENELLYERIRSVDGWLYQVDAVEVGNFATIADKNNSNKGG